jgi:hypothetical protein
MRERVALYGGEATASRGADGGFVVRATLPVPTAPGSPAPAASPRIPGLVAENLPGAPA